MLNRKSLIAFVLLAAALPVRACLTSDTRRSWDESGVHFVLMEHGDLGWLATDLARTKGQPIVIEFARGTNDSETQITNNAAFLNVIRPYNVRFLLIGQGDAERRWNVEGITTVMSKEPFLKNVYPLVKKSKERVELLRRLPGTDALEPVAAVPLSRPPSPNFLIHVHVENNQGVVTIGTGQLPEPLPQSARLSFRVDGGKELPIRAVPWGWTGEFDATGLGVGVHRVDVLAVLPDGRQYRLGLDLTLA